MAYIGKTPVIGNFVKLDSITVVNGQAAYTMQNGGVNFTSYDNVNQFLVSLNGVLQAPTDSFTVSGSTLTFASNLSTGDVIDFVLVLGNSLDIGTPSDNTISTAKLQANAVTSAKLFSTFKNGITEVDQWRITADHSGVADITANWERVDTDGGGYFGTGMSQSSGIFTFPSTGYWLIIFSGSAYTSGGSTGFMRGSILTTLDGGTDGYSRAANSYMSMYTDGAYSNFKTNFIFDVTNTADKLCKFSCSQNSSATPKFVGATNENYTTATFIRLGDSQ